MVAGQLGRDTRLMVAVLVALNALAFAAVFDLGGVLKILAILSLLVVLVTAIAVWTARAMTGGHASPNEAR
jgi:hypothetical protein